MKRDYIAEAVKVAPDILEAGAATYRERNSQYGDNYLKFGKVMMALFPHGVELCSVEQWNRFGVFVQCVSKLTRYAAQAESGHFHRDSAHDLMVYAAMLEELSQ
jgi:hypothetical protein